MKNIRLAASFFAALAVTSAFAWEASIVSSVEHTTFYRGDVTKGNAGMNGGDWTTSLFNGTFDDYRYQNTAGAYLVVDLDDTFANGCYVTEVKIGHKGNTQYSLYWSADGTTWTAIIENTSVPGTPVSYTVEKVAKKIKYVWDTSLGWGGQSLAEIQVWGVDPSELGCTHPAEYVTEWESIPGTANCTEYGIDQCSCTNCGTFFTRLSPTAVPLGHDYATILTTHGTSLFYGSGSNVCKRCSNAIAFDEPRDLVELGGFSVAGLVQFTDISVSSIQHPEWGIQQDYLIDGNWTMDWKAYWAADSSNHDAEYIDFEFGAEIDLTAVDFSVPNHDHIVEFYSVDGGGVETLIGQVAVEKNTETDAPNYQRFKPEFRGVSLSKLRIRTVDAVGFELWGAKVMAFGECHPYGTVKGAGKSAAVRTRIIID
ncbi:MAG: hypothetical protein IJ829_05605 [Kiritimatiellae bacterium]|nr:hypothetical protein [Kiritimatiellia bacterium]